VVNAVAPQLTDAVEVKLAPAMVSVKASSPANAEAGLRLVIVGIRALIVNTELPEVPAFVVTVMLVLPAVAIKSAETIAVNCVALT
jgi:hypothetical protein